VRVNELLVTAGEVREALSQEGVETQPAPGLPEGILLEGAFDVMGSQLFEKGALTPQSRASMLVSRVLAPRPGERVLDLCAAPGAKTTHIAALMEGEGTLVAVERNPRRAGELERNLERMRAGWVEVLRADATDGAPEGEFDRVLLDAPCSALGTLRGRPDARWRKTPQQIEELQGVQSALLDAAATKVRAGGTLVYSTCTISPAENEEQAERFLARHPGFEADDLGADHPGLRHGPSGGFLQLLPHRDGTDGFFISRFRRQAA
jgi:16S rRNA (cytosine967-C5)-methyltransferase